MSATAPDSLWVRAMPAVFVLIWSTGFIVARYAMPHASPFSFLALRYLFSVMAFGVWIAISKPRWPSDRMQWLHLAATGVLMHAGYLGGVWAAVKSGMGAAVSSLIVGLQPVLTVLWLTLVFKEGSTHNGAARITPRQWLGVLLGFAGVLLVLWPKLSSQNMADSITPFNLGLAVVALLSITAGTLYQKRFLKPCDVRTANVVQIAAALLVSAPLALWEVAQGQPFDWVPAVWGSLAWAVLGLTLGGSSLLYLLVQKGAAASVSSLMYLVPPCTAFMAWALFGERITLFTFVGTALTAWGVSWVVRTGKAKLR